MLLEVSLWFNWIRSSWRYPKILGMSIRNESLAKGVPLMSSSCTCCWENWSKWWMCIKMNFAEELRLVLLWRNISLVPSSLSKLKFSSTVSYLMYNSKGNRNFLFNSHRALTWVPIRCWHHIVSLLFVKLSMKERPPGWNFRGGKAVPF